MVGNPESAGINRELAAPQLKQCHGKLTWILPPRCLPITRQTKNLLPAFSRRMWVSHTVSLVTILSGCEINNFAGQPGKVGLL